MAGELSAALYPYSPENEGMVKGINEQRHFIACEFEQIEQSSNEYCLRESCVMAAVDMV